MPNIDVKIELENILFAGTSMHLSAQKFLQAGAAKGLMPVHDFFVLLSWPVNL